MKRKLIRYLLLSILLPLITLIGILSWLIATEAGFRWLTTTAQRWAPGQLTIATAQGRLLDKFSLTTFSYHYQDMAIQLAAFDFEWEMTALFHKTLHIKQLHANDLKITLPHPAPPQDKDEKNTPLQLPDIRLPLKIALDDLQIDQITIKSAAAAPLIINTVNFKTTTTPTSVIPHLTVHSPLLNATLTGHIGLQTPHPIQLDLDWSAHLPQIPTLSGQGQVTGDTQKLTLTHQLTQPVNLQLHSTLNDILNTAQIEAQLDWQTLQWPLPQKETALITPYNASSANSTQKDILISSQQGQITLSGTHKDYHITVNTHLTGADIPPGHWNLTAQGNEHQLILQNLRAELLKGIIKATGQLNWQSQLAAQLTLQTHDINLKALWKDWPDDLTVNSQLLAKLNGQDLTIDTLDIKLPQTTTTLSLIGKSSLKKNHVKAMLTWQNIQWPLNKSPEPPLIQSAQGRLNLLGTLQNYQVDIDSQLIGKNLPLTHLNAQGQGNTQQFTFNTLRTELLKGLINATGQVHWKPRLAAHITLDANHITLKELWKEWPDALSLNSQLTAKLEDKNIEIKQLNIEIPETATQVSLKGTGTLAGERSPFEAALTWRNLHWPLTPLHPQQTAKDPAHWLVNSAQGQLNTQGNPQAYQLHLETDIAGQTIPTGRWQATGQGDLTGLHLQHLQGTTLQGLLNLSGQVNWKPVPTWQLTLNGNNINPGSQWPQWPGKLAFAINNDGKFQNGELHTQLSIKQIQGQLRDYPLYLQTELALRTSPADNNMITIKRLDLRSSDASLSVAGTMASHSQLTWKLTAPNLATLLPQAQGSFQGVGSLTGPLNSPRLMTQLEGKALTFQNTQLASLKANVDIDLQKALRIDINATDFKQGQTHLKNLSLQGQGSIYDHTLNARATLPKEHFSLQLRGGFKQPRWQGHLRQLTATETAFGDWQLHTPAPLTLSPTEISLAHNCLQNHQTARLCSVINWKKGADSTLQVELEKIPLAIINSLLPPDSHLTGTIEGALKAQLRPQGNLTSDLTMTVTPGTLKTKIAEEFHTLPHQGGALKLQVTDKGLSANLGLKLLKRSTINGTLALPRFTHLPPQAEQPVQAHLETHFADLNLLPTLFSQLENTQGKIDITATLEGTLTQPQLKGKLSIAEVATQLPDLGLELKKTNITLHDDGHNNLMLQGNLHSGEGQLTLKGKTTLTSITDWQSDLTISGTDFEVINTPTAWAIASPEIYIHVLPGTVQVKGSLTIPEAAITPSQAENSAVTPSEDVTIISPQKKTAPEEVEKKWAITSEVRLVLGDKVTFKGAGFKSHLKGSLLASNQPHTVTIGNGELQIIDGTYKAYGQNLAIKQGQIIFAGGPIDNPGLDISATRHIRRNGESDVSAGVRIQGTAQSPKISLFSEPVMDESNMLSYILLGKPAAQATESEGSTLLSAAASMRLEEGDSLTKKIGQQFGFDEAGISSEGGVEEAALVVGKYLSPSLYISYGIGLFDGSSVLRMRYELTKKLMLETETGTQSGVDLRYMIER